MHSLPTYQRLDTIHPLEEVVVTGTRTQRRKVESPALVRVIHKNMMQAVPAISLSDALHYLPGLRVEVNCQTCSYSQLRMNGLPGAYAQILINGRPIFSPLLGLYGLEQLPTELIEKVEVVKGAGSSLYGSSAIGGTVNIITKLPERTGTSIQSSQQLIGMSAAENSTSIRSSWVAKEKKSGLSFLFNTRGRQWYDVNGDGYSELPKLNAGMLGMNAFFHPDAFRKLEISVSYMDEYRHGGSMSDLPVQFSPQAEERKHRTWMGNLDYRQRLASANAELNIYAAWQQVTRAHYTGVMPEDSAARIRHFSAPPFGGSQSLIAQFGMQWNIRLSHDSGSRNLLVIGTEYLQDNVMDSIPAYRFLISQQTRNLGFFTQAEWWPTNQLSFSLGARSDMHNLIKKPQVFSPRLTLMYRPVPTKQLRVNIGSGFRAPQAFEADLHMAFAAGGVSRIRVDSELREERSLSMNISWNADYATSERIFGYTLETFYTRLYNSFALENEGQDSFGEVFLRRNRGDAFVGGINIELRAEIRGKLRWEAGFTWQRSRYEQPIHVMQSLDPMRAFIRTPDTYGYNSLTRTFSGRWRIHMSQVYTGRMQVPHFAGSGAIASDRMINTKSFLEHNLGVERMFAVFSGKIQTELFAHIRNLTNRYQKDFDRGPFRDSNYIYGPAMPRSLYMGLRCRYR